ncbi:hypothetical protein NSTC745_04022 [Nostoc sp. DSM 114161]|jgi:hypothetical protein
MDPQASLTAFMGLGEVKLQTEQTIYGAIAEETPLYIWEKPIHGMHLVPTNIQLAGTEQKIFHDLTIDNRQGLSLSEIRILVGNILQQQSESKPSSHNQEQKEKADKIYKALRKSKIWNDEKKLKKINKLFAQIEALLEEENKDDPSLQQGSVVSENSL